MRGECGPDGNPDIIHTYPINDVIKHITDGDDCPCGPTTEPVERADGSFGWHVMHHSLHGREFAERGRTIPKELP